MHVDALIKSLEYEIVPLYVFNRAFLPTQAAAQQHVHVDVLIKSGQSSSKKEAELLVMQQKEFILSPLAELDAQVLRLD